MCHPVWPLGRKTKTSIEPSDGRLTYLPCGEIAKCFAVIQSQKRECLSANSTELVADSVMLDLRQGGVDK
jgi:hypothetical protein